jgi:hypothetical protein
MTPERANEVLAAYDRLRAEALAAPALFRELRHLVLLLEPLERDGRLDVPGLATLNGARKALDEARPDWRTRP